MKWHRSWSVNSNRIRARSLTRSFHSKLIQLDYEKCRETIYVTFQSICNRHIIYVK